MHVAEGLQGQGTDGMLGWNNEQAIAQFAKHLGKEPRGAIG